MAFKYMVLAALVAVAKGGVVSAPVSVAAPIAVAARVSDATFDPNPQYSFAYDVQDALTGDSKSHVESRSGDIVQGQYTVADPDGTRRIVDYAVDPVNGFNAVVRRAPLVVAAPVAPLVEPAAPVVEAARVLAPAPAVASVDPVVESARILAPAPAPVVAARNAPIVASQPAFEYARISAATRLASPLLAAPTPVLSAYAAAPLAYSRVAAPLTYPIV